MVVDIRDVITCFKFGDDRFRGLASAEGQILPFPIPQGRPYNTLTLPCERVIRLMLVDLPPWRKTEMQNLTFLSFSMQVYACYRAQSLYTPLGTNNTVNAPRYGY